MLASVACQDESEPQRTDIERSCSRLQTYLQESTTTYQTWKMLYAKQLTPDQNSC